MKLPAVQVKKQAVVFTYISSHLLLISINRNQEEEHFIPSKFPLTASTLLSEKKVMNTSLSLFITPLIFAG